LIDATTSLDHVAKIEPNKLPGKDGSKTGKDFKAHHAGSNIVLSRTPDGTFVCSKGGTLESSSPPRSVSGAATAIVPTPYADYSSPHVVLLDEAQVRQQRSCKAKLSRRRSFVLFLLTLKQTTPPLFSLSFQYRLGILVFISQSLALSPSFLSLHTRTVEA
jgi:hypothetical protein